MKKQKIKGKVENEMTAKEALKTLNKYRNNYYNSPIEEEKNVAQALNIYLPQQAKKDELLELKNREIKLLKARLTYNDNDECQNVLFFENSNALEDVRDKIKALEEEMK
jgi:hypothetical protein